MRASIHVTRLFNLFRTLLVALVVIALVGCRQNPTKEAPATTTDLNPFESYIAKADTNFSYELIEILPETDYDLHVLRLVSQKWLTAKEVRDPLWWHWLTLVIPHKISTDTAFLWIGSGNRGREAPKNADPITLNTALESNSIGAYLHNIPNQPLEFSNDDFGPRYEDELISYGWRQFLESGATDQDAKWLARLPMTKAVVRAMDVIADYSKSSQDRKVIGFTVAGASKRGWTTWTTAAVDQRVVAIVPVVIDMLNVIPSFQHHWQVYGFWAPAVNDYVREGIMNQQESAEYNRLVELVEPYSYRDRLTIPKLIINASGDQFFVPDSWKFYWADLPGEKHLRYVANTDHSLKNSDAISSLVAFHKSVVKQSKRPKYQWEVREDQIQFRMDPASPPSELIYWSAYNEEARDFRLESIGTTWQAAQIPLTEENLYTVPIQTPKKGWSAHFLEVSYRSSEGPTHKFTSGIKILPDTLPFAPFQVN